MVKKGCAKSKKEGLVTSEELSYVKDEEANGCLGKLFISNKEIARGRDCNIILEGEFEGRKVAIKQIEKTDVTLEEIQGIIESSHHPNIVQWYGMEFDPRFTYLAIERCTCNLGSFIKAYSQRNLSTTLSRLKSQIKLEVVDYKKGLWDTENRPTSLLFKLFG